MNQKCGKRNAVEAYEKPSMQVFEMEMENALMKGASEGKPGWGPDKDDGGLEDGHTAPPGQSGGHGNGNGNGKSYMPERNTRPYMGDYDG